MIPLHACRPKRCVAPSALSAEASHATGAIVSPFAVLPNSPSLFGRRFGSVTRAWIGPREMAAGTSKQIELSGCLKAIWGCSDTLRAMP